MSIFGNNLTSDVDLSTIWNGVIVGTKFTLSEIADITQISARCEASTGTINCKAVIYADNSGSPGARKGVSSEVGITTSKGWYNFPLTVTLPAGTYWLCIIASATSVYVYHSSTSGNWFWQDNNYTSPTDPCGSVGGTDARYIEIYATYTTKKYTKQIVASLPANTTDLSTELTESEYTNVATDDSNYVDLQ